MRIGLVGAGAIALRHIDVLERRDGVDVVAVADTDDARAANVAGRLGASVHPDWAQMLEAESLDAVFVCTPPEVHAPPAMAAFERGLAVYLEKPLARTDEDGAAIARAWQESGVVCAIGYQWRSLDVVEELRSLLAGSAPGMVVSRSFGNTESGRGDLHTESWFTDQRRSGGILYELGSHDVDLQIAIAGPVEWAQATAVTGTLALAGATDARLDDAVSVVMRFAGGGIGSVSIAWTPAQDPAVYSLDVQAPDAALSLELDPVFRLRGRAAGRDVDSTASADPRESSIDRFLEAARAGDPGLVPCSPGDALATLRTLLACERAIATGERVPVAT